MYSGQINGSAGSVLGLPFPPWNWHATLFDPTGGGNNINLNGLIDPDLVWELGVAECINDNGWIAGAGWLLIPVPRVGGEVDIKPGSYPNAINLDSYGLIPVAFYSGEEFDATTVDPETIELAGSGVAVRGKGKKYMAHKQDVDLDGWVDLLVHSATDSLDSNCLQEGYATLTGKTYDGEAIEGWDEITIVPPEQ